MMSASGTESSTESLSDYDEHSQLAPAKLAPQQAQNGIKSPAHHLVEYTSPKVTAVSSKLKTLWQQFTPKNKIRRQNQSNRSKQNLAFALDRSKQTSRLKQRFQNYSEFSVSNFTLSPQGRSAILQNIHPVTFTTFSQVINKFCGANSSLQPRCAEHNGLSLHFTVKEQWDSSDNEALVRIVFSIHQFLGSKQDSLGSVVIHYTTCNVQVQGSSSNVPVILHHIVEPLIAITNQITTSPQLKIDDLQCIDCTLNSAPSLLTQSADLSSQLAITNKLCASAPSSLNSANNSPLKITAYNSPPPRTPASQQPAQIISPTIAKNEFKEAYNRLFERVDALEEILIQSNNLIHELQLKNEELSNKVTSLSTENTTLKNNVTDHIDKTKSRLTRIDQALSGLSVRPKTPAIITTLNDVNERVSTIEETLSEILDRQKASESQESGVVSQNEMSDNNANHQPSYHTPPTAAVNVGITPTRPQTQLPSITEPPPQLMQKQQTSGGSGITEQSSLPHLSNQQSSADNRRLSHPVQPRTAARNVQSPSSTMPQRSQYNARYKHQKPRGRMLGRPPPPVSVKVVGASNLGRMSSGLRNAIPGVTIHSTPGGTFDLMVGQINRMDKCDILVISGGVNEADTLDDVELARYPLREAIRVATWKAAKVVVMPPPPLNTPRIQSNIRYITNMMREEADYAKVGFVDVDWEFGNPLYEGQHMFDRKGLHVNKLGSGIYAMSLIVHLYYLGVRVCDQFCVRCQHTDHIYDVCSHVRNPPPPRYHPPAITTSNMYYALHPNELI